MTQHEQEIEVAQQAILRRMLALLDAHRADYHLFRHRPVHSYADAQQAQEEAGFEGDESKALVCRADRGYVVYVTLQGRRMNMAAVSEFTGVRKLRLARPEELQEDFAAEPGAAYPFGFADDIPIAIDPIIFGVAWFLCSAADPTVTLQIRGAHLQLLYDALANPVHVLPHPD